MREKIWGISGIKNLYPLIDKESAEIIEVWYPDVDMQDLPFDEDTFDFVISAQVIEHLENPQRAINESYRVLKGGGIALHTTCFMNRVHPCPDDYWRFSPPALKYLCRNFSEILQCEGWGNRIALICCFVGFRRTNIPDNRYSIRHLIATRNEKKYPIVTWVVAKK